MKRVAKTAVMILTIGAALGAAAWVGGCSEQLLTENEARSQYDRNDAARDRRAPSSYFDNKGDKRPNIRGRVLVGED